jgi:hypothetical protein
LAGDVERRQASKRAHQLVDEPPPDTAERQCLGSKKRPQPPLDLVAQKFLQATAHLLACLALDKILCA